MNAKEILALKKPVFVKWAPNPQNFYAYWTQAIVITNILLNNRGPLSVQYFYSMSSRDHGNALIYSKVREYLHAAGVIAHEDKLEECIILKNDSKFSCAPCRTVASLRGIGGRVIFLDDPSLEMYEDVIQPISEGDASITINIFKDSNIMKQIDPDGTKIPIKHVSINDVIMKTDVYWSNPRDFFNL